METALARSVAAVSYLSVGSYLFGNKMWCVSCKYRLRQHTARKAPFTTTAGTSLCSVMPSAHSAAMGVHLPLARVCLPAPLMLLGGTHVGPGESELQHRALNEVKQLSRVKY